MRNKLIPWFLVGFAATLPFSIALSTICFGTAIGLWLLGARWTFSEWPPTVGPLERWFLVFLGISVISALIGPYPMRGLREIWRKDFYFFIAVLLIATWKKPDLQMQLLRVFVVSSIVFALWGVIQRIVGVNQWDARGQDFSYLPQAMEHWPRRILNQFAMINGRVAGTRSHPLTYAEGLLFGWGYVLVALFSVETKRAWRWFLAALVVEFALIASLSRGPWLAAAAMGIAALMLKHDRAACLRFLILGLPALTLLFSPVLKQRATSILDRTHHSNSERIEMWRAGFALWKEQPWFGIGPANVKKMSPLYQSAEKRREGPWGHLHSTFVNMGVERGLLGLGAYMILLLMIVRQLWKTMSEQPSGSMSWQMSAGALLGILGFLLSGLTETVYNDSEVLMMFYFVVGLSLAAKPRGGLVSVQ